MSIQALSEFTRVSRYAKFNKKELRRETWHEMVDRVFDDTHAVKYKNQLDSSEELRELFAFAKDAVLKKDVLGAQRLLQFSGDSIRKHNTKLYNCSFGYIDRIRAFPEALYLSLCGTGVGFSVQKHHVAKLPTIKQRDPSSTRTFVIPDSIEGWADSIGILLNSFFDDRSDKVFGEYSGVTVAFDYSQIRPEGALIAGQFKAPGPASLAAAHIKIVEVIERRLAAGENRLRPIDCYDLVMHFADCVLSGGVRRSATICLFGKDDQEMMTAKTGNWFVDNPQRARSNNSVLLVRDQCTREEFAAIMKSTREFGEPGFVFSSSTEIGYNPCCVAGDTILSTDKGEMRMDELVRRFKNGESIKVASFDLEKMSVEFSNVSAAMLTRANANIIEIETDDGRRLSLTPDHRVYTKNRGYVQAAELTGDDELVIND